MVNGKGPLSSPGACNGLAHVHTDLNTEERPDVQASQLLTLGLILVFILACSSMWSERAKEKGEEREKEEEEKEEATIGVVVVFAVERE